MEQEPRIYKTFHSMTAAGEKISQMMSPDVQGSSGLHEDRTYSPKAPNKLSSLQETREAKSATWKCAQSLGTKLSHYSLCRSPRWSFHKWGWGRFWRGHISVLFSFAFIAGSLWNRVEIEYFPSNSVFSSIWSHALSFTCFNGFIF